MSRKPNEYDARRLVALIAVLAVVLRLALLMGRGDYLAFDEGWYLLLARSLFTGDGYSLVGFPHTALSPLFPILAGATGELLGSWVWGGRLVAAVAAGLLVLPAWAVFRRLAEERTALVATALVAVLPSLAPFTVPFWIGADLWVGAEPLLHLFLYTGVALWMRADADEGRWLAWLGCGAAFGLAFLARPEAVVTWGLLGLVALGLAAVARSPRRLYGAALMGVAFVVVAAPYWLYVRDVTGQWSLTGRGVSLPSVKVEGEAGATRSGASRAIERMLWQDDEAYRERLYGLDETGLRLRAGYWGVAGSAEGGVGGASRAGGDTGDAGARGGRGVDAPGAGDSLQAADSSHATGSPAAGDGQGRGGEPEPAVGPSVPVLYVESMSQVIPLLLWVFVVLGAARPRGREVLRRELPVAGALVGTSLAIAVVVAVDPRTQLFLAPLLVFYAAQGFRLVEETIRARGPDAPLRPGFAELILVGTAVVWLLGISARRLQLSLSLGSPHHIVGAQNRAVAEELDALLDAAEDTETDEVGAAGSARAPGATGGSGPTPGAGPVASWHPAIAVYADRDWRVLPYADLPSIVRYLDAAGAEAMVLSAYYPPDLGVEDLNTRYLVLPVPDTDLERKPWRLRLLRGDSIRAAGRLEPIPAADEPDEPGRPGPEQPPPDAGEPATGTGSGTEG